MNNYEEILERHGNGSMKWERAYIKKRFEVDSDDIYPLFIADMDYRMDEAIHKEMQHLLENVDFGYFHVQKDYYDSILTWFAHVHHVTLKPEWILPSVGTITSLHIACECFVKGKGIATFTPVYGSFAGCMNLGTGLYLPLELGKDGQYQLPFEQLEEHMKQGDLSALLLCSPHNPGGRVWTREELYQLVCLCKTYGVYLFADEIHSDLTIQGAFVSLMEFAEDYDRILVSTSANKTFNISGLCASYLLCANPDMLNEIRSYMDHLHLSANRFGIEMTRIAYTLGEPRLAELKQQIKANFAIVKEALNGQDVSIMEPQAGYLLWVRLNKLKECEVDQFVIDLAKNTHVLLERGSRFLDHYENFVRINVATSPSLLKEAMKRFAAYYQTR